MNSALAFNSNRDDPTLGIDQEIPLDHRLIRQFLSIYKPEFVSIAEAKHLGSTLKVILGHFDPGIYVKPQGHLSRVQIVHFVGQSAYVLAGCMAAANQLGGLDASGYLRLVTSEAATFRKLKLAFKRYVPNRAGLDLVIKCRSIRNARSLMLLKFEFDLDCGACSGEAEGVLVTDPGC